MVPPLEYFSICFYYIFNNSILSIVFFIYYKYFSYIIFNHCFILVSLKYLCLLYNSSLSCAIQTIFFIYKKYLRNISKIFRRYFEFKHILKRVLQYLLQAMVVQHFQPVEIENLLCLKIQSHPGRIAILQPLLL